MGILFNLPRASFELFSNLQGFTSKWAVYKRLMTAAEAVGEKPRGTSDLQGMTKWLSRWSMLRSVEDMEVSVGTGRIILCPKLRFVPSRENGGLSKKSQPK